MVFDQVELNYHEKYVRVYYYEFPTKRIFLEKVHRW